MPDVIDIHALAAERRDRQAALDNAVAAGAPFAQMAADLAAAIAVLRESPDDTERATAVTVLMSVRLQLLLLDKAARP